MKTITLVLTLVSCWSLTIVAQGVQLEAGDSVSIGFDALTCHFTEGNVVASFVNVDLGTDFLTPGESLRLEMFENSLADAPFASQTYNPAGSVSSVSLAGPSSDWGDHQGVIRVSMLSGSVSVIDAYFYASSAQGVYCDSTVIVPEPRSSALVALGGIIGGFLCLRNRRSGHHRVG